MFACCLQMDSLTNRTNPTRPTTNKQHQQWVSTGNTEVGRRLCKTHEELFGHPGWSENGATHYGFKHGVFCCPKPAPPPGSPIWFPINNHFTFPQAQDKCSQNNLQLCSQAQICPNGPRRAPVGGTLETDIWTPVTGDKVWVWGLSCGMRGCVVVFVVFCWSFVVGGSSLRDV